MAKVGRPPKYGVAMTTAERMKAYRARKRAAREAVEAMRKREAAVALAKPAPAPTGDLIDALAAWSERVLVVPPGHPLAGNPMVLPDFAIAFLRDAIQHRESPALPGAQEREIGSLRRLSAGAHDRPAAHSWMAWQRHQCEQNEGP